MTKIILIGGPPRTGKTTLAQRISKEADVAWISTDALDDIAQRYIAEEERSKLFPKTSLRKESGGGNDELYNMFSVEEIVSVYRKQSEAVYKAVEVLIAYAHKEGWDYVVEGYHITPTLISKLKKENSDISGVILTNTKADGVIERSMNSDVKKDWLRDKTKNKETFPKIAEMVSLYSQKLQGEAEGLDVDVIDVGESFQEKLDKAFELLTR